MKKVLVTVAILLALFGGCATAGWLGWAKVKAYPATPRTGDGTVVTIEVPADVGPVTLCALLEEKGVIDDHAWFCWYMRYVDGYPRVQKGTHLIANNLSPEGVLAALAVKPRGKDVSLTLPEGLTIVEMAPRLDEAGVGKAAEFIALATDPATAARVTKIPGLKSLEGFLFPETYRFVPGAGAAAVIEKAGTEMVAALAALRAKHPDGVKRLAGLGWGDFEWVTLASIVQKETGVHDDPRNIAAVFVNRMTDPRFVPKRLDSDPTVIYGMGARYKGNLLRADLDDVSNPYNTYTHVGLPPGPISAPGRATLEAVIDPTPKPWLFFVAKGDGSSYFSVSMAEHAKAVDCFQRKICAPGFPPPK
jgi:UPF0755 protein